MQSYFAFVQPNESGRIQRFAWLTILFARHSVDLQPDKPKLYVFASFVSGRF